MSLKRKLQRAAEREQKERREERRAQKSPRALARHQHMPEYRGKGHAFAYCSICGVVMATHPQPKAFAHSEQGQTR